MTPFSCDSRVISHMFFTAKVIGSKTFSDFMGKNRERFVLQGGHVAGEKLPFR